MANKRKKDLNFQNIESLTPVVNVVNDAKAALNDKGRTIRDSAIPDVLGAALGAGVGGVGSFAALYGLGVVGLSAPGITSALAALGAIVGGGMVAGIFVLASPIAALAAGGTATVAHLKRKQLDQEKERLYKEIVSTQNSIMNSLKTELNMSREREDYLKVLNTLLQQAIKDLKADLGNAAA